MQSEEYVRYMLCREFGWDYHTYEQQPPFFIEEIMIFLLQENKRDEKQLDKPDKPIKSSGLKR